MIFAVVVLGGCDDDESEPPVSSAPAESHTKESSTTTSETRQKAEEESDSGDVDADDFNGEVLEADDAAFIVEIIARHEAKDGRRLATHLALQIGGTAFETDDGPGWEVKSSDDEVMRARFRAGGFEATFEYDSDDGLRPVDTAARQLLAGDDDIDSASFMLVPDAYDPTKSTAKQRWTPAYRGRFRSEGQLKKLKALSAVLAHSELIEDATDYVVDRAGVDESEFEQCKISRDCRWHVSERDDGGYDVAFEGGFEQRSVKLAWNVDLDTETLYPDSSLTRWLHQVRRPVGHWALSAREGVDESLDAISDDLPRLSDENINDVIGRRFTEIRSCVLSALDDMDPGASPSWDVEFVIRPMGGVDADSVVVENDDEEEVTDREIGRCLNEIFVALEFPPPGTPRGVRYPIDVQ